jgi:hypothetical protein
MSNEYKPYVPQYREMGITPTEARFGPKPNPRNLKTTATLGQDNSIVVKQSKLPDEYKITSSYPGSDLGAIPNISSVDSHIVDDVFEVDPTYEMVDNNEFLTDEALGYKDEVKDFDSKRRYILLIKEDVLCTGEEDFIQNEVKKLVFGEHELFPNIEVPVEDITVFKRVKIKIGVFLE